MSKLYRCNVVFNLCVLAESEKEALAVARKMAREENTIDTVSAKEITDLTEVPYGWMCSYPYVSYDIENELTVAELLGAQCNPKP